MDQHGRKVMRVHDIAAPFPPIMVSDDDGKHTQLEGERPDEDKLKLLMESMKEIGLLNPVIVIHNFGDAPVVPLYAGRYRLEAARRLGWEEIPVFYYKGEDGRDWGREATIAENFIRGMTDDEARKSIAHYVRRYCGGKVRRGNRYSSRADKMSVKEAVENISKKIGVVPRTVERMLAEGEALLDKMLEDPEPEQEQDQDQEQDQEPEQEPEPKPKQKSEHKPEHKPEPPLKSRHLDSASDAKLRIVLAGMVDHEPDELIRQRLGIKHRAFSSWVIAAKAYLTGFDEAQKLARKR
jgi:hypothetical protein